MKAIQLTDEYRSKLLEMCEKLFPEYTDINMFVNGWEYSRDMEYIGFDNAEEYIEIHWFEFCVTYLTLKIGKSTAALFRVLEEEEHETHLVDYLYSEFKKLLRI